MTLRDGKVGDRIRTKNGHLGTIKSTDTRNGMPFYGVQLDEPALEWLHFTQVERASEERTTKTLEQRLNSAEKNLVDHEHAIGDNSGRISLVEQIDIAYDHLRRGAKRIETLERNVGGHEHAIGRIGESQHEIKADHRTLTDDHGKVVEAIKVGELYDELNARRIEEVADKTAQRLDEHRTRLAGLEEHMQTIERLSLKRPLDQNIGLADKVAALEALITEDKIGSWRRATEAVGGRLTAHDRALNQIRDELAQLTSQTREHLKRLNFHVEAKEGNERSDRLVEAKWTNRVLDLEEKLAELEDRLARNVVGINGDAHAVYTGLDARLHKLDKSLAALWRKFDAQQSAAKALRDGPKSYDKRLAALERMVNGGDGVMSLDVYLRKLNERVTALEYRDDDPLRRVPGVYSGTGDDATDDAPADPASRDIDSLVDQTAIAVRDFLAAQHESLIEAGVAPYEARNRVKSRRHQLCDLFFDSARDTEVK